MEKKNFKIPVVVVLGHIDHGKSSLLEAIRKDFQITSKESGGITQHIGAYEAEYEGKKITFIDTPGHESFSEMRSRGAKVADVAILVVAADEGVKTQTIEAIKIIKESKIPYLVALNKIDKENADSQRVKTELQNNGVLIEEWGGDIPVVEVSAKTGQGIENLLSLVNLLFEMSEVRVDINKKAEGFVLESYVDPLCGVSATLIIEDGKLKKDDIVRTDTTFGKIRTMKNFIGDEKDEAIPGEAVFVVGLKEAPVAGEKFFVVDSLEEAQREIEERDIELLDITPQPDLEKYLKLVLKADCRGSLEVLVKILKNITQENMGIKILKAEVGEITDSDIRLAEAEEAIIVGFRVEENNIAKEQARQRKIQILKFEVIYDLIDSIRKELEKIKEKKKERVMIGKLKPLVIFKTQKRGERNYRQIVGVKVLEGEVKKSEIDIERNGEMMPGGKILEIQEQKKKIEVAKSPQEVGISYEGRTKVKEGDILLVYEWKEE